MSRLFKNIIYNVVGQGLVLALTFVAVRFIFRGLGDDAFGLIYFNLLMTAVIVGALELGIGSAIVREVSGYQELDPGYVRNLVRTTSLLYWGLVAVFAVVLYLAAPLLVERWITLHSLSPETATSVLRILGIAGLLNLPRVLYTSLLRGLQRMEFNNAIDIVVSVLIQLGIVVILAAHGNLYEVSFWIASCYVLSTLAYMVVTARFFGWAALLPRLFRAVVTRNVRYTGQTMSISVLSLVQLQSGSLLVSKLMPISSFGFYGLVSGITGRAAFIASAVAQAAFPSLSSLHRAGDERGLLAQYRKLNDLLCYVTLPLFALIVFAAVPVFSYVITPQVAHLLLLPTAFLSLGFYMSGTVTAAYVVSLAVGRPDIAARANLLALFVVLPVTAGLVVIFGLAGAAFSWVFYNLFLYVYAVPRFCRECLHVPVAGWYARVARVYFLGVATYGLAWLAAYIGTGGSYTAVTMVVTFLAASIAFGVLALMLIGSELKDTLHRLSAYVVARRADPI